MGKTRIKYYQDFIEETLDGYVVTPQKQKREVHWWQILFDFVMILLTHGLWLIWVGIRYIRSH